MLEQIIAHKRLQLSQVDPVTIELHRRQAAESEIASFSKALRRDAVNIIAEIKYHSPSRGDFPCRLEPVEVAGQYCEAGAAAISVLTDERFFKGEVQYLRQVHREHPQIPLLRKDFILQASQVVEARAAGASAYLLIVSALSPSHLRELLTVGSDYQIESLVEVHDERELDTALQSGARIIGVNNRNLKTFEVDLNTSFRLARRMEGEAGYLLVSESGISERVQITELRDAGFRGFLIGSSFMETDHPGKQLRSLLENDPARVDDGD